MAKRLNKNLIGGLTALAFVVLTAAGVFMASSLRKVDPAEHVRKAEALAAEGNYEKAAIFYARAFDLSKDPEHLLELGTMRELNGQERRALDAWNRAVTLRPDLIEAHEKMLDMYFQGGGGALRIKETSERIRQFDENNPKALYGLGMALIQLAGQPEGDREKGMDYLREAHEIAPEVYRYTEALVLYYWTGAQSLVVTDESAAHSQMTDALEIVRQLVADNPSAGEDATNAHVLYARMLSVTFPEAYQDVFAALFDAHLGGRDRFAEAERLYDRALELAGDDEELRSNALTAHARYWFQRAAAESDESKAAEFMGRTEALARRAIEIWPTGFGGYGLLATMYAQQGEAEKAARVCVERTDLPIDRSGLRALRQKRSRIELLLMGAEQYLAATQAAGVGGRTDRIQELAHKAEQLVEDAKDEVPDADRHGPSLHIMGKVKFVQNKEREALAWFERADRTGDAPGWQNKRWLGILRFQNGQIGGAREALLQATRDPRADAQAWLTLGQAHLRLGDLEAAEIAIDEALKRQPDWERALQVKVDVNARLGRTERVAEIMEQYERGTKTASVFRARVLYSQGKYQDAFDMLRGMLNEDPTAQSALRWLGVVASKIGKEQEAFAAAARAVELDPDNVAVQLLSLQLNPDLTDEQRREKRLEIINATPDEYLRTILLAEHYGGSGEPEKALAEYTKATRLIEDDATEQARSAGSAGLLALLERRLQLAVSQKLWDEVDAIVETAVEHNVDGAHGLSFRGRALAIRERFDEAAEAFRAALDEQPSQSQSWEWLGRCHLGAGRKSEAQGAFARAAEMNPTNFTAQLMLARLAKSTGDLGEFNARLDECLKLDPDNPWVREHELLRQEERNPAEGIARRAALLEANPDDLGNRLQLARLYGLTGNLEKAAEHFDASLGHPDATAGVRWRAAQFFARNGDRDRAFRILADAEEASESNQDKAQCLRMAGTLHSQLGDLDSAEAAFRRAVDVDPGERNYAALAEHYLGLRRHSEALRWLDLALTAADQNDSPLAPRIRRARFEILLLTGNTDGAQSAAAEYRERYPRDAARYRLEAQMYAHLGQVDEAVASLTRYLQDHPGDPAVLYQRAQYYASRERWVAAIKDLEDLRAVNPDALNYAPRVLLSVGYDRTRRSDLALSELKSLYEDHPTDATICQEYFTYCMKHQRYADAETLATAQVNRDPNNPRWDLNVGRAATARADGVKALASFRSAAEKADYAWQYVTALFDAYAGFQNISAGISFYEETLPEDKRRAPVTYRYANLLVEMGRVDEAVAAYRRALVEDVAFRDAMFVREVAGNAARALGASRAMELFRKDPADETLRRPNQHILASLMANSDQPTDAIAVLDALIDGTTNDTELASLYGRKALVAESFHDYNLARECYEKAIAARDDDYIVLNNFAYLLSDKLRKSDEAVPYAEKARQLNGQPAVVDTLAWALVDIGQYGRAIGLLSGARQRNLEFVPVAVHLAEAYRRNGDFDDAIPLYKRTLELIEAAPGFAEYLELSETGLRKAEEKNAEP